MAGINRGGSVLLRRLTKNSGSVCRHVIQGRNDGRGDLTYRPAILLRYSSSKPHRVTAADDRDGAEGKQRTRDGVRPKGNVDMDGWMMMMMLFIYTLLLYRHITMNRPKLHWFKRRVRS